MGCKKFRIIEYINFDKLANRIPNKLFSKFFYKPTIINARKSCQTFMKMEAHHGEKENSRC